MALTKKQKQEIIDDLKEMLSRQKAIILVGITGLKVKDISQLRKKLKAIDGNLKVVKKTLIELAFKESKLEFDKDKFKEEIALVWGFKDEILPAKTVYQFSRENEKLKILGGYLEGNFKEAEEIITLAQIPTREELIAKLIFATRFPLFGFYDALQRSLNILKVKS